MNYRSTRNRKISLCASQTIVQGLSPDGGLFIPESFPLFTLEDLEGMEKASYQARAVSILSKFLDEFSEEELAAYAGAAYGNQKFSHPDIAPVRKVDEITHCLELWHGPTCAFKDMALQMLPHLLSASLQKTHEEKEACILVATSGDTGKAALEGFRDVEGTRILVFYPKDGVSDIQELQMITQEGQNVGVCSVIGNFDDAQTTVKQLFADQDLRKKLDHQGIFLSSANSINWGRVLPQMVYYCSAYIDLMKSGSLKLGEEINVCVPTGNFGNILAGYYAKKMGVPIKKLICASNSNNILTDFIHSGTYDRNRPFYTTISPSMDILISSNLERLLYDFSGGNDEEIRCYMDQLSRSGTYQVSPEIREKIGETFLAGYSTDEQTQQMIHDMWLEQRYLIDPHTAVAFHVLKQYRELSGDHTLSLVVSTASPFKFCSSVLSAIGVTDRKQGPEMIEQLAELTGIPAPDSLVGLKEKPVRFKRSEEKDHLLDYVLEQLF